MIVETTPLKNKNQTGRAMYRIVNRFATDLRRVSVADFGAIRKAADLPLVRWFDYVRKMPYRIDPKPREILARPAIIMKYGDRLGADCKKKSLLIAAWLKNNNISYRFVAASRRPDKKVHHVFPQGKIANSWINLDATYSNNKINQVRHDTKQEVLKA